MKNRTQFTSEQRVVKDTVGNEGLQKLYNWYRDEALDDTKFMEKCLELIDSGTGTREKINEIKRSIKAQTGSGKRSKILVKTQNFALAGMGLRV